MQATGHKQQIPLLANVYEREHQKSYHTVTISYAMLYGSFAK